MLSRDRDWVGVEGMLCRVDKFLPADNIIGRKASLFHWGPRGIVKLTCLEERGALPPGSLGAVFHKLDYTNLHAAIIERGVADDEEAVIVWSRTYSYFWARWLSPFMPRMVVLIFKKRSLRLLLEKDFEPELSGEARFLAEMWVKEWKPHALS